MDDGVTKNGTNGMSNGVPQDEEGSKTRQTAVNAPDSSQHDINSPDNNTTATDVNTPSKEYAFINPGSGTCTSCNDTDAMKVSFECWLCCAHFHATCRNFDKEKTGDDIICPASSYTHLSKAVNKEGSFKTRPGNFVFMCNPCKIGFENERIATKEDKVDVIDRRVTDLSKSMLEMKAMLSQLTSQTLPSTNNIPEHTVEKTTPTMAMPVRTTPTVLYADKLNSDGTMIDKKQLDHLITDSPGIQVESSFLKQDGSAVFSCPTPQDSDKLKKAIADNFPASTTKQASELLPTISLRYLETDYPDTLLQLKVMKQNPTIQALFETGDHTFKILDIRKHKFNNRYHATIRVSNDIRIAIKKQNDKIFIGSSCCPVTSHVHVKRCNHCQKFGHYAKVCNASVPTCGYCASHEHQSDACTKKDAPSFHPCCPNCMNNKFKGVSNSHSAFANDCPSYLAEQERIKSKIFFYNLQSKN